jgi:tetratricopeptide (TPR) repeat protein
LIAGEHAARIKGLIATSAEHIDAGRRAEAEMLLRQVLALDAHHADGLHLLGLVAHQAGHNDAAVELIGRAIAANGTVAFYFTNLGSALQALGRTEEAIAAHGRSLALDPNVAAVWHNLGCSFLKQRELHKAGVCFARALALDSTMLVSRTNLGVVRREQGNLDEAVGLFEEVVTQRPEDAETQTRLGFALQTQGRYAAAIERYARALALAPEYGDARWNRALLQLLHGEFGAGWENYECRWGSQVTPRNFTQPQWRGEALQGARILLHAEQGLGDTLQFLRYVPMVRAAGGSVVLEVQAGVRRIAEGIAGVAAVVTVGEELPAFGWHCPLMSLPLAFGTAVDTIPTATAYLPVPEEARRRAAALAWPKDRLRVGVVWAGNPEHHNDRYRSIPPRLLAPLFGMEGVAWYSLQMGAAAEELAALQMPVTDLRHAIGDMGDTAALMEHMDLVLAVDTSVVHLAGAMGRDVWLMLPFAPDWRWLLDREDSPWYPSMRLFRQPKLTDWETVVERVWLALTEAAIRR